MRPLKDKIAGLLKKDCVFGLDIGASSIKSALFKKQGDGLLLTGFKTIEINQQQQQAPALKEALAGVYVKGCEVVTVINSAQAMVKRVVMPLMPYAELREAVSLEAKNYFPFPVVDSLIDFQVIGETVEKGIKKIELLLGVCPQELMREHLHLLSQAGVRPSRAIHPGLAIHNLLRIEGFQGGLSIAALDMGKSLCDLIIIRDGKLAFSRKIPLCGDDFTRAATSVLFSAAGKVQLSYEEAERAKKDRGFILDGGQELIDSKITPAQLFSLFRPLAEKLASEIERSFDSYREEAGVSKVDKLILFGGGARLKGLEAFLSESLSIEAETFSSLGWLKVSEGLIDGAAEVNRIAVAAGAGLSGTSGINLLPLEIKQERIKAVRRATLKAGVSAAATIMLLVYAGMRIQSASINKKIAAAKLELSALQQSFGSPDNWELMRKIIEREPYYEDVLKEISNAIPDQICLNEIKMEKRSLIVTGIILSPKNPEEILSRFIHSLEHGIFKNVRFAKLENGQAAKEFSLRMEIE